MLDSDAISVDEVLFSLRGTSSPLLSDIGWSAGQPGNGCDYADDEHSIYENSTDLHLIPFPLSLRSFAMD